MSARLAPACCFLLLSMLEGCGGTVSGEGGGAGHGGAGGVGGAGSKPTASVEGTYDFVVTELNFHYPEGLGESAQDAANPCGLNAGTDNTIYKPLIYDEVRVDGFDLDGMVSTDESGNCGQSDFQGADGTQGVDDAFLRVIDMIRPIRPDQIARGVLAEAPSEGLINFGIRLAGVDDWHNDDSVQMWVVSTIEPPVLGTDGRILPLASVTVDPNPAWQTRFTGRIVDGVLTTDPADFTLGDVDLLVVEDRVLRLQGARIRATFTETSNGIIEVDSVLAGWWSRDNMLDVIGRVVLAIGANDGELACSFDMWADRSSDGVTCDTMSIVFETRAVSGFLTELDQEAD